MMAEGRRNRFLVFAIVSAVLGVIAMACLLVKVLSVSSTSMTRFAAPGIVRLTVAKPATYDIYIEYESVLDGQIYRISPADLNGLKLEVISPANQAVHVATSNSESNYTIGLRKGVSLGSFQTSTAGDYLVKASYLSSTGPTTVVAIDDGSMDRAFLWIVGGGLADMLLFVPILFVSMRSLTSRIVAALRPVSSA
jgi:hypothetical protein